MLRPWKKKVKMYFTGRSNETIERKYIIVIKNTDFGATVPSFKFCLYILLALGKLFSLSTFTDLQNRHNNNTLLISDLIYLKHLQQCLAHNVC